MRWNKNYFLLASLLFLLAVIAFNYNYLSNLTGGFIQQGVISAGYFAIIIFVFVLEFIPQPLLSALVPFTTGLLFGLDFKTLLIMVIATSLVANYLAFFIGKYYSSSIALSIIDEKNYKKVLRWFKKYGKLSISFLALTPLPYFPVVPGILKMSVLEFTIYGIIPRIFHFAIFSYIIWAILG